ncbi:beta strand repeat-containing protein [Sphingomonas nostoxanthinifaciens]|uniref:beta strand repeat-containing protein n=1 Tax=Sphingomonas nostoxanthinifaciens TaxID=2872652 RepID=UPI001CC1DAEB|nr:autotransporter domain-containing protein [Sphingomonas nostoxanthinifaciens]UAK24025.1 autotransporter domain-containing protein [Sphingomonas nostoxanthinifaciens]
MKRLDGALAIRGATNAAHLTNSIRPKSSLDVGSSSLPCQISPLLIICKAARRSVDNEETPRISVHRLFSACGGTMTINGLCKRQRIRALAGASIFPLSIVLAAPAFAQCAPNPTVAGGVTTCSGVTTNGLAVTTINSTVNVAAGALVGASTTSALTINAPVAYTNYESVIVSGQVAGNGTSGIALYNGVPGGSSFGTANLALTVAAGASVGGTNAVVLMQSSGNSSGEAVATIVNSGSLTGTSGVALRVDNPRFGAFASITNRAGGTIGAIVGPVGVINNAGVIDGGANSAVDVGTTYNSYASYGTWTNTGTITSGASTATVRIPISQNMLITNGGTISNSGSGTAISGDTLSITNQAGGRILAASGTALSVTSQLTLTNAGSIVGDVIVASGASGTSSVVDSTAGTISGNVMFGAGNDVLVARYTGTPALVTGIGGTIDGGGGTNSVRIKTTQDTVIATALQLPSGFQNLQLQAGAGTTVTLANGFVAPGTIALVADTFAGAGSIVNNTALTFTGQAFTSQIYSGAAAFTNNGSIRASGGAYGIAALALDGVATVSNSGLIDVVGNGIQTSINGTTTNTGTIVATGTAVSAFDNYFVNRGLVRSTGGIAVAVSGNSGNPATNSGRIEGATVGVATSIDLTNTGTIIATAPTGTAVALDAYGSLINAAGGVVGNGSGNAVTASVFNSTVVNAGTINGSVTLTGVFSGANQRYIALPGGILNGNLTLGAGSLLVTDINNSGPGSFAGITGTVTAGAGSALRYRVSADAAAVLGPVGSFQDVSYEVNSGATLSLTAAATRTQTLQLAGSGTVNLNAAISTTSTPAIQATTPIGYPGAYNQTSQLTINSAGAISLVRAASSYAAGAVSLGTGDSFNNSGTITVVDRQSSSPSLAAVAGGMLVTNSGAIQLDGAIGISGAAAVVNTGAITQSAGGATAQGMANVAQVLNQGTINVAGTAVQLGYSYNNNATSLSLTNSGTLVSTSAAAVTSYFAASLDNSGTISGGAGTAVQLSYGDDNVTLRTGSIVSGVIDGGGGNNTATLAGTIATATPSQTIASFSKFNALTVASGYWTAPATGGSSFANNVTIASGATLEDADGATGLAGATAPSIVDNGTLVVRSSATSAGSTFGTTRISGTGDVLLTGAGTVLLDGANSLGQSGGTTIDGGTTVMLTGTQGGNFTTRSGGTLQIGTGGTAGTFAGNLTDNGTLLLNRSDDYALVGAVGGSGLITKLGAGTVTFAGAYTFTGTTDIEGGAIKLSAPAAASSQLILAGSGRLDLSGLTQTVAALSGTNAAASITIANGALTVNQASDTAFAGTITGSGSFTKSGAGRLVLTGNESYSGGTTVAGGILSVNGSLASPVTVTSGGTLGGTGTVGAVTIAAGGTYAPGNSIGTQTVAGNLTFAPGSTYLVEANAAGQADRINASGSAALAGKVAVRADASGTYANLTSYRILTAAGGVTGTFDGVSSNLAFLTPDLVYGANGVTLLLARNDVSFASIATDRNQASVAGVIQPLGLGNPIYDVVLGLSAPGARAAFSALSGEIHASLPTTLLLQSQQAMHVALQHAADGGDGIGVWGQALYDRIEGRAGDGVAQSLNDQQGGIAGIDIGRDGLRAGVAGGYVDGDLGLVGRASHADIRSKLAIGYVGWGRDALQLYGGASYSWHDVRSRRSVDLGSLGGAESAHYKANVVQLDGKVSYAVTFGGASIAPFVGASYLRVHRDGFTESGTAVALAVARSNRSVETATAGVQLSGDIALGGTSLLPRLSMSYQRNWGNVAGIEHAALVGTTPSFGIVGTGLGRNALRVEGGAEWKLSNALRIGADLFGEAGGGYGQFGARGSIAYRF